LQNFYAKWKNLEDTYYMIQLMWSSAVDK
jgi:hypothetical protein